MGTISLLVRSVLRMHGTGWKGKEQNFPKMQSDEFQKCCIFGGPPIQMEAQQVKDDGGMKYSGNDLPPPSFSDVLAAQHWATAVVQQTDEEANKRGRRGSQAWEDVWRDALWTLAVQKRCVEVEARRYRVATAAQATKTPPTSPVKQREQCEAEEQRKLCEKRVCVLEAERDDARQRLREVEAKAEDLARQIQALPHEQIIHVLEAERNDSRQRLQEIKAKAVNDARKSHSNQHVGMETGQESEADEQRKLCEKTVKLCDKTVRMLEAERDDVRQRLREVEAKAEGESRRFQEAEIMWQQQHLSLQKQMQREEMEIRQNGEAEEQRKQCEKTLLILEAERDEARKRLREVESKAEHEARKFQEAEATWQQRHASLQKQLRRSELSLGFSSPGRSPYSSQNSEAIRSDLDSSLSAIGHATELEALRSPAIVDLLREVRSLERKPGASPRSALRGSRQHLHNDNGQVNWL